VKVKIDYPAGAFGRAFKGVEGTVAKAAKAAVEQMASEVKTTARANIVAAGLGPRLARALRVDVYPRRGYASIDAAAVVRSKADYMEIFDTGGKIEGDPLLWLPLSTTPKRIKREKLTPASYRRLVGPLFTINRPGHPPLLAGNIAVGRRSPRNGPKRKVSLSALRRGNAGNASRLVPLFVGIRATTMPKKTNIRAITEAAAAQLPALVIAKLRTR
jgi:hypothetical protein